MGGGASNAPGSGLAPLGVEPGEQLLRDFKVADEIAETIANFESWSIEKPYRDPLVEAIQDNPALAETKIAPAGIDKILLDSEEREELTCLTERHRELNIFRFLGKKATFKADEKGRIASYQTTSHEDEFVRTSRSPKKISARIASLQPSRRCIQLAHGVIVSQSGMDVRTMCTGRYRWNVNPFVFGTRDLAVEAIVK